MVDTIPQPDTNQESGTPDAGAAQAMRQALSTVVRLQQAVSDHVAIMIPGELPRPAAYSTSPGQ